MIHVVIDDPVSKLDRTIPSRIASQLREQFPATRVTVVLPDQETDSQDADVRLRIDLIDEQNQPAAWAPNKQVANGTLKLSAKLMDVEADWRSEFIEKPWVENYTKFLQPAASPPLVPRQLSGIRQFSRGCGGKRAQRCRQSIAR